MGKKYLVVQRSCEDDSILEVIDEFDNYEDAEICRDECGEGLAAGAEIMKLNRWDEDEDYQYTDPADVYHDIVEQD